MYATTEQYFQEVADTWRRDYALVSALLARAKLRLHCGSRVCDPIGTTPAIPAVRDFVAETGLGPLDLSCGLWPRKPELTILVPGAAEECSALIFEALGRADAQGEVCALLDLRSADRMKFPSSPDIFLPKGASRAWIIFGPERKGLVIQ